MQKVIVRFTDKQSFHFMEGKGGYVAHARLSTTGRMVYANDKMLDRAGIQAVDGIDAGDTGWPFTLNNDTTYGIEAVIVPNNKNTRKQFRRQRRA